MNVSFPIFKEIPLVRLLPFLLLGITSGIQLPSYSVCIASVIISILLLFVVMVIRVKLSAEKLTNQNKLISYLLFSIVFFISYAIAVLHIQHKHLNHFNHFVNQANFYEIQITNAPIAKAKSLKVEAKVDAVYTHGKKIITSGKLIAYIEKNDSTPPLNLGDILYTNALPQAIPKPKNPFEFNYKDYLQYHNVNHSIYIPLNRLKLAHKNEGIWLNVKISKLRNYLSNVIQLYISGTQEQAIAEAILIGKKDLLDDDTIRAYSSSGAMHVLAVSGLHVGIVYLVIYYVLFFLNNPKYKKLKAIITILFIWFYALLTGASPSVLRAATMFSFIAVGQSFRQQVNMYNMIAASAFILLLINPFLITEVGFQLSYLAVIGIIFLQPYIYNLWIPSNWVLDKIWGLTAVSIAAQIATFPLGLLYFHQFPNFFFISNLVVIPAATLIVYIGVLLFVISPIAILAKPVGFVLSKIIWLLNESVAFIDKLPYSLSTGIHITTPETYWMYIFIIALAIAFIYRYKKALFVSILFLFVFAISLSFHQINATNKNQLIVYFVPKLSAIEFKSGNTAVSYFDSTLVMDESQLLFRIKHNWWGSYLKQQQFSPNNKSIQLIEFQGDSILLLNNFSPNNVETISTDIAILSHYNKLYIKELVKSVKAKQYVFDSSNKSYASKYWKEDCESLLLDCYFVNDTSAFIKTY